MNADTTKNYKNYNYSDQTLIHFFDNLFKKFLSIVGTECDCLIGHEIDKDVKLKHDIVLMLQSDDFSALTLKKENMVGVEREVCLLSEKHPSKRFIFVHNYIKNRPQFSFFPNNVRSVSCPFPGGGYGNGHREVIPVLNKNEKSNKVGISLNRTLKNHRLFLIGYLYGLELDKDIHITAVQLAKKSNKDLLQQIPWFFSKTTQESKEIASNGFSRIQEIKDDLVVLDPYQLDTTVSNFFDNFTNFDKNLRYLYQNSFVEIVAESVYDTPESLITEKSLHSVYGCNFPIILGSKGIVQHLRHVGFDMFDDIVNHSYDDISDPASRLQTAIQSNIELFTNKEETINKWNLSKGRFIKNLEFIDLEFWKRLEEIGLANFKKAYESF
jgi:hypothetical protein